MRGDVFSRAGASMSAAAMSALGSAVPRHEQSCESDDLGMAVFGWCMGHMAPSPWPHVHVVPMVLTAIVEHSAVGTNARRHNVTTSQPPVRPATCERIQRMDDGDYHGAVSAE